MMPVAGCCLLESTSLLAASARNFAEKCVDGLTATGRGPALVAKSPMLATALNPVIGYDEAAKLAKRAMADGRNIRELAAEAGVSEKDLERLDPSVLTEPGLSAGGEG